MPYTLSFDPAEGPMGYREANEVYAEGQREGARQALAMVDRYLDDLSAKMGEGNRLVFKAVREGLNHDLKVR